MKKISCVFFAVLLCGSNLAQAQANGEPTLEEFKAIFEPAILNQLVDPESARFEWPFHFSLESNGYLTCGYVNSKNRMGGYAGRAPIVAVYNKNQKPYFNILDEDGGTCPKYITKNLVPRNTAEDKLVPY